MVDLIDPEIKALYDLGLEIRRFVADWEKTGTPTRFSSKMLKHAIDATDAIYADQKAKRASNIRRAKKLLRHMEAMMALLQPGEP